MNPKVSGHNLVMYLNKTHNFECCVDSMDVRMDIKKTFVHKRLNSLLKRFLSVGGLIVNIIERHM